MNHAGAMLVALALDAAIGWPAWLFARIGHPVTWMGALVEAGDRRLNRAGTARRLRGAVLALGVISVAAMAGWGVQRIAPAGWAATLLCGMVAWPLLAVRSMHDHVAAVARPLDAGDLEALRDILRKVSPGRENA